MADYREIQQAMEQAVVDYLKENISGITGLEYRGFHTDDEEGSDEEDLSYPLVQVMAETPEPVGDVGDCLFEFDLVVRVATHFVKNADPKRQTLSKLGSWVLDLLGDGTAIDAKAPDWIRLLGFSHRQATPGMNDNVSWDTIIKRCFAASTTDES